MCSSDLSGRAPLRAQLQPVDRAPYEGQWLDFPRAERADVLRGLRTFAQEDDGAEHLAQTYAALPSNAKALGSSLGDGRADSVRDALQRAAANDA